jgi:hypothetical protein
MGDCCLPPSASQSWIDFIHAAPPSILDIISNATLASNAGTFINSSNYAAPGTWNAAVTTVNANPTVAAVGTDNLQSVADAAQWSFLHQTANLLAATPIPLQKILFLKAGTDFQNNIVLAMGGTFTEIQLGFRDAAGTRGDAQGTYPVIDWTGSFSGNVTLGLTFNRPGYYALGLWGKIASNYYMMEIIAVAVP